MIIYFHKNELKNVAKNMCQHDGFAVVFQHINMQKDDKLDEDFEYVCVDKPALHTF